jgi:hypothetical protein
MKRTEEGFAQHDLDAKTVTVRDAVTFHRDGEIVGRVHAIYDVSELPEDLVGSFCVMRPRLRVGMIPTATVAEYEIRRINMARRVGEWEALPLWRRIWRRRPRFFDPENLDPVEEES